MGNLYSVPYVPHIINVVEPTTDMRLALDIPKNAYVFGRYGGADTFDISWAWSAINRVLYKDESVYFLFMNTNKPDINFVDPKRVIFLPPVSNPYQKSSFIYACDAMLHARSRGETFGISVGEFAVAGRPVLTYGASGERAHIYQLGPLGIVYFSEDELVKWMFYLIESPNSALRSHYDECSSRNVMMRFKEVFLT
jgi:glycosyltransferase involved in cell wall biosynthesis